MSFEGISEQQRAEYRARYESSALYRAVQFQRAQRRAVPLFARRAHAARRQSEKERSLLDLRRAQRAARADGQKAEPRRAGVFAKLHGFLGQVRKGQLLPRKRHRPGRQARRRPVAELCARHRGAGRRPVGHVRQPGREVRRRPQVGHGRDVPEQQHRRHEQTAQRQAAPRRRPAARRGRRRHSTSSTSTRTRTSTPTAT